MKLLLRAFLFISLLLTLIVGVGQTISARPCRDDQDCGKQNGPGPREPTPPETPMPAPGSSPIEKKYAALGGEHSFLGAPTLPNELTTPDGIGRYRHYEHGSIYWSPSTGAHEVHGYIGGKWASLGWEKSYLGYPTSDELGTPDGVGRYNSFQNGIIYWAPEQGAADAPMPIRNISLVREQSKPDVYLVIGGYKLWIPDAHEFAAAGFARDKVQVVPDGALDGYHRQFFSAPATTKASDVFFDCGQDYHTGIKDMELWTYNCKNSQNLIRKDVVMAGWLAVAPEENRNDSGIEDIHYDIIPDPDFIDRMYGPGGLSTALDNAVYPGHPYVPDNPLPFVDVAPDGTSRGVDYNSFAIPGSGWFELHGELNAWHVDTTGCMIPPCINPYPGGKHYIGRGQAPAGWHKISFPHDDNVWWPFEVFNPDDGGWPLRAGDYVVIRGALWQDGDHEDGENDPHSLWNSFNTRGHSGWTEIHPVDWVVRVNDPGPPVWKSTFRLDAIANPGEDGPVNIAIYSTHSSGVPTVNHPALPGFSVYEPSSKVFSTLDVQELIDGRISQMSTVMKDKVVEYLDHVEVHADVFGGSTNQGRFKASYIVTWKETDVNDVVWVDDNVPAGATQAGSVEGWNWQTKPTKYEKPYCGTRAHQSDSAMGIHQHLFSGATNKLLVNQGDKLLVYVYIDPKDIPYELMLQWNDGTWEHRAYWGANLIPWGVDGTASRRYMGPISVVGEWLRLEVPADLVGLEGRWLNGMAFTLFGGHTTWDCAGKWTNGEKLVVSVTPYPVRLDDSVHQITVEARDASTGLPVPNGIVRIRNFDRYGNVVTSDHPVNTPFRFTFNVRKGVDPITHASQVIEVPSGKVIVPGYSEVDVDFGFR